MLAKQNPYIESAYKKLQIISQDKEKRLEYDFYLGVFFLHSFYCRLVTLTKLLINFCHIFYASCSLGSGTTESPLIEGYCSLVLDKLARN